LTLKAFAGLLLAAAGCSNLFGPGSTPIPTGHLAFYTKCTESPCPSLSAEDLFVIGADGTGLRKLNSKGSAAGAAAWAPDGTRIAFEQRIGPNVDLYVSSLDGSPSIRITTDPAFDGQPTWSPDGQRLAFISKREGKYAIYVMNADGSAVSRLTDLQAIGSDVGEGEPAWSPDGTKIAFTRDGALFTMNIDGSAPFNISAKSGWAARGLSWSPDGTRIAFLRSAAGPLGLSDNSLIVIKHDGSNPVVIAHMDISGAFSWSPNSLRIAFTKLDAGEYWLVAVNSNGSGSLEKFVSGGVEPSWSPDGRTIVFQSGTTLFFAGSNGSSPVPVPNAPFGARFPFWSPVQ